MRQKYVCRLREYAILYISKFKEKPFCKQQQIIPTEFERPNETSNSNND